MGRAINSFSSMLGHTAEPVNEERITLPEKDLWIAVLTRAVLDACKGPPDLDMTRRANVSHKNHYHYNRDQARHFFVEGGSHFKLICEMAGRNPTYVQDKIRKVILRKNGWNVDVPITSHYRRSEGLKGRRKRGRPRKNSTMVLRGNKGGRPRLYGV